MSRIPQAFAGKKPLIAFITAGYPTLNATVPILRALEEGGAGLIEVGVAFSDPIADGPVIQSSSQRALDNGATLAFALQSVKEARGVGLEIPVVLMGYYNSFLNRGLASNAHAAAEAGVDGVIISDLPPEEASTWQKAARQSGLDTILLLAPTSTNHRIKIVAENSTGFIYCVSRLGVTGVQSEVSGELAALISRIKKQTTLPLAVGFGISSAEQVRAVIEAGADGVVVGSALVKVLGSCQTEVEAAETARRFIRSLANGIP